MSILKLPVILIVFSVALNHLEATSIEKQEWLVPVLPRNMLLELKGAKTESEIRKSKRWFWQDPKLLHLLLELKYIEIMRGQIKMVKKLTLADLVKKPIVLRGILSKLFYIVKIYFYSFNYSVNETELS